MLFDGPLCRVESWKVDQGRLNLSFSHTTYKWFWGTNLSGKSYPVESMANALGLSAALESSDGFLMFGRRNRRMAYHPKRVHPFAGSAVGIDVFGEMRRELFEELAIGDADISEMACIGMAEDLKIRQPELVFFVRASLTRAEIEARLDGAEHDGVWMEGDDGVLTPIALAVQELWRNSRRQRRG
jgi:hypothetical protein